MAYYLWRARMAKSSIEALVSNPQDRTDAARTAIEAAGGRLHHYFFALGEDDIVVIAEFPDNVSVAGATMVAGATGALENMRTTALLTMDEAVTAMQKAKDMRGAYTPPKG